MVSAAETADELRHSDSRAFARALRPYVVVVLAWFLSTNLVVSRHADAMASSAEARGRPALILMQPLYTMFYTMVLSALFSMAWVEYDERFGSGDPDLFMQDALAGFPYMGRDAFVHFVVCNAIACAAGLAAGVAWGVYMKRVSPPADPRSARSYAFRFCCIQLVVSVVVVSAYSACSRLTGAEHTN